VLEPGRYRCDDSKHGNGKFEAVRDSYFIRMEKDSALCWPYVTWKDLDAWDELALLDEEHSSKEWLALLLDLLKAHGLADAQGNPVELKPPAVTSSGGGLFDEDDDVSRLDDEMDADHVDFPPKLSKRFFADSDSVSATPSTYRRWKYSGSSSGGGILRECPVGCGLVRACYHVDYIADVYQDFYDGAAAYDPFGAR
jgi:hypothetical protein